MVTENKMYKYKCNKCKNEIELFSKNISVKCSICKNFMEEKDD